MNLFANGQLDTPLGLLLALVVGLGFGFWLERAGFGSSRKLTAIFYLQDFAVLKVMFSAMATAAVVLQVLAATGHVQLADLFAPPSVLLPQVLGGLLFGAGFVAGGWCPGTAAVGLASGKIDAAVFLLGAGIGSLVFAVVQPQMGDLLTLGTCAIGSLPEQAGVSPVTGTVVLVVIALVAFIGASRVEAIMARRNG